MKRILKVRFPIDYDFEEFQGEVNALPSETIPDESLTIKEILVRFTQGVGYAPGSAFGQPHYDPDGATSVAPWNDPDLTLSDLTDMRADLNARISELRKKAAAEQQQASTARSEAEAQSGVHSAADNG